MDFNLIKGEKWFFDEEFEIGLVVLDKFEITSNRETYPAMAIKYINRYPTSEYKINNFSFGPTEFVVTPLNPNPIFIGDHYQKIAEAKWSIFQTNNDHQPTPWIPEIRESDVRFISIDFQWESNQSFGHKSYPINRRAFCNLRPLQN